jgi:predicted aspartyl protease
MPILHVQLNAQVVGPGGKPAKGPDGKPLLAPPKQVLQVRGPLIQVSVGVMPVLTKEMAQEGIAVPSPITGQALIDTGASNTCIDAEIAAKIGAPVIDKVTMHSASHASTEANIYPVHFDIIGLGVGRNVPRCMGAALQSQGIIMLIGRDALVDCNLFYNGLTGSFTFSF